ncbi:conjugal transfer protein TraD, partial [Vibrio parahaemolyticus]
MSGYVEGLLRPADELLSAAMFGLACVSVTFFPNVFLLPVTVVPGVGLCLFLCAMVRFKQGLDVVAYRKGLLTLPYWAMNSDEMPVYQSKLFLGKGFLVLPRHAQRLYDSRQIWAERYVTPSKLYDFARRMEAKHEGQWIERFWSGKKVIARSGVAWGILNSFLAS